MGYTLLTFPPHVFKALFISGAFVSFFFYIMRHPQCLQSKLCANWFSLLYDLCNNPHRCTCCFPPVVFSFFPFPLKPNRCEFAKSFQLASDSLCGSTSCCNVLQSHRHENKWKGCCSFAATCLNSSVVLWNISCLNEQSILFCSKDWIKCKDHSLLVPEATAKQDSYLWKDHLKKKLLSQLLFL